MALAEEDGRRGTFEEDLHYTSYTIYVLLYFTMLYKIALHHAALQLLLQNQTQLQLYTITLQLPDSKYKHKHTCNNSY